MLYDHLETFADISETLPGVEIKKTRAGYLSYTVNGNETLEVKLTVKELEAITATMQARYQGGSYSTQQLDNAVRTTTYVTGIMAEYTDSTFSTIMPTSSMDLTDIGNIANNFNKWGTTDAATKLGIVITLDDMHSREEINLATNSSGFEGADKITLYNAAAYCYQTQVRYVKLTLVSEDGTSDRGVWLTITPISSYTLDITLPVSINVTLDPNDGERLTYIETKVKNNSPVPVDIAITSITPQAAGTGNVQGGTNTVSIPVLSETDAKALPSNQTIQSGMGFVISPKTESASPGITERWYVPGGPNSRFAHIYNGDGDSGNVDIKFGVYHTLYAASEMKFGYDLNYHINISADSIPSGR
jgi:hypothetical protein